MTGNFTDEVEAVPGICKKYASHKNKFIAMAKTAFGSGIDAHLEFLKFSQIVRMTGAKLEDNEDTLKPNLVEFYKELSLMFGDPDGQMTPMATMYLTVRGGKRNRMTKAIIADMLLDENGCNLEKVKTYTHDWIMWQKEPDKNGPSPCIRYREE